MFFLTQNRKLHGIQCTSPYDQKNSNPSKKHFYCLRNVYALKNGLCHYRHKPLKLLVGRTGVEPVAR